MVEAAVCEVGVEDETTHWNLYSASEMLLGECDSEEKFHRAQRHLELYAKASGDPNAVLAVARRCASGTAVLPPDVAKAVDWYFFAIALGMHEAEHELQALLGDV